MTPPKAPAASDVSEGIRTYNEIFRDEVIAGLSNAPKELPSKYFYDETGSRLFDRICELEEYYPTRTELRIMADHGGEMAAILGRRCLLIEYGSGSSIKTRRLLDVLDEPAGYVPIDISCAYLEQIVSRLVDRYPTLEVQPVCADYTSAYEIPETKARPERRVVYFPGSTIGNLHCPQALAFLRHIVEVSGPDSGLLIGVDLKKDRAILERAYNDASGVTAAFNLNLLKRLRRELGADLDPAGFTHRARYNEEAGRVEMHLVSESRQTIRFGEDVFTLEAGETIHTESSYKYTLDEFADLAQRAGYRVKSVWTDPDRLFSVQYLQVVSRDEDAPRPE